MSKKLSLEVVDTRAMVVVGATRAMVMVGVTLDVVVDVMDIHGEAADMVAAAGTVMARDVQGVVALLMKPLMLNLKMISRIDQF